MTRIVADDARVLLSNMRESMSLGAFLDSIWAARDHQQESTRSAGKWPFIRACDRPPEAVVDVARLPTKLRANNG